MAVDVKKVVIGLVLMIVFIILVFLLVGNSAESIIDAADSVTDANNCSLGSDAAGIPLSYNFTDKTCGNSTDGGLYTAGQFDLPLNSLFGRSGVLLLVFMAVILIVSIVVVLKGLKGKK